MLIDYKYHQLPHGAKLYTMPRDWSKTCAIWLYFDSLYYAENKKNNGVSYLALKMLLEGTSNKNHQELATAFEAHGIDYVISPSGIQFSCIDGQQQTMLQLILEIICYSHYTEDRFQKVKKQTITDYILNYDDIDNLASEEFRSLLFKKTKLSRRLGGSYKSLQAMTLTDCELFRQKFFNCANLSLFVAGRFSEKQLLRILQQGFSNAVHGKEFKNKNYQLIKPQQFGKLFVLKERGSSSIVCGHSGVSRWSADYSALKLIDCIIGASGNLSNRLNRRIREELGLCYHIYSDMTGTASRYAGFLQVCASSTPDKTWQIIEEIKSVFLEFLELGPSPAEMENTRLYLKGALAFRAETNAALTALMKERACYQLAENFLWQEQAELAKLTAEQALEIARKYYFPDNMSVLVVGREAIKGFLEHKIFD